MTAALVAAPRKDVHPGVREVQDPDFWGLPLHTPLTPAVKAAQKAKGFGGGPASRAAEAARLGGGEGARVEVARQAQPSSTKDRIRNWFRTPEATGEATEILDGFDPRTFQSDQQAGQYALGHARPGRFERGGPQTVGKRAEHWSQQDQVSIVSDSIVGFHEAQAAIRKGDTDSPQAKAFIARFQRNSVDMPDDLLVSRRVPVDSFPDGVEGLAGKEIRDAAYFQGNLGTPIGSAPVLLTVAVPKGTRAMFTGNGPNDRGVILDRDQRLQITKVLSDGKGGWYVAAVAVPRSGAPAGELKEGRTGGAPLEGDAALSAPPVQAITRTRNPDAPILQQEDYVDFERPPKGWSPEKLARAAKALDDYNTESGDASPWNVRENSNSENVRLIDELMDASSLGEDVRVWRGIARPHKLNWFSGDSLTGRTIDDPGFMSTSVDKDIALTYARSGKGDSSKPAAAFLLRVNVPRGTKAIRLGGFEDDDPNREVLLERGLKMTVTSDETVDGVRTLDVQVARREQPGAGLARRGGPGAPDLLERETGTRKPGFAQPRRFSEPETHAAPPAEQRRLRVQETEEPSAIRQVRKLPDDITEELNNPKTTIARMREISKEYDFKVPGSITKKMDVRDFLLGKQKEGPQPERKQLSAEAVAQLEDPKTTVAQLRKIAKDHGIKIPSTATRKADIKAHLVEIGDVRSAAPDSLKPDERDDFRAGWDAVGKAPAGSAQRELNEVFIDVRGGRMGLLEGARRLDTSVELDREELGRVRGKDDKKAERLEEEIAAKEKAAKFLRDYQEKRAAPTEAAPAPARKAVPRKAVGAKVTKAAPRKAVGAKAAKAAPARSTTSQGPPRAVPELDAAELEKFNEGQLRVMAKNRGIGILDNATKAEIVDALTGQEEGIFSGFSEEQLRLVAQARGIHVPADATRADIVALLSAGGGPMSGSGSLAPPVPHSMIQVRPVLAEATGHRGLARATQAEYKRITGRDLEVDFGPDPDLSLDTSREHMEGVLRAAEFWPDTDLRRVGWFNGDLSAPGQQRPWAVGGNGEILFNTAYTSKANREQYLRELEAGIAGWDQGGSGFHPRGANTPAAVAMHEFGHLIAPEREARGHTGVVRLVQRRAREDRVPPSRLIRREVSLYAEVTPAELVAEAILDVLVNGDAAGRLSRQIADLLRTGRL